MKHNWDLTLPLTPKSSSPECSREMHEMLQGASEHAQSTFPSPQKSECSPQRETSRAWCSQAECKSNTPSMCPSTLQVFRERGDELLWQSGRGLWPPPPHRSASSLHGTRPDLLFASWPASLPLLSPNGSVALSK